jgi:hypothetical protein
MNEVNPVFRRDSTPLVNAPATDFEPARDPALLVLSRLTVHGCRPTPEAPGCWRSRCPLHVDSGTGLVVRQAGGACVVRCPAGCDLGAILATLRLTLSDLFSTSWLQRRNLATNGGSR